MAGLVESWRRMERSWGASAWVNGATLESCLLNSAMDWTNISLSRLKRSKVCEIVRISFIV